MRREKLRTVLRELIPEARAYLVEAIRLPSTHGNEVEVVVHAEETWREAGFEPRRHPMPEDLTEDPQYTHPGEDIAFAGRENLVVRVPGAGEGRSLILNSHLDVVPAEDWSAAFEPEVREGIIRGRGACDAKGCVAAMFLAVRAMQELGLKPAGDLICQMVIDEEVGGNGSLALMREGVLADAAVVLEPTQLHLHPANRGAVWFRLEFEGESCHMGRKHEGVNAVGLACEAMEILHGYEEELRRDAEDQPLFASYELPAQVNVGVLRGGEWPSMVAGSAVMEGGVGFLPNRPMERVKQDLARLLDEEGSSELRSRYRLSFPRLHNDSYETPPDHPFVEAFHEATRRTDAAEDVTGWNVSCDARLLAKVGGMPTVVFGPGSIQDAHSAGECVRMDDILTAAETLVRAVEEWCGS